MNEDHKLALKLKEILSDKEILIIQAALCHLCYDACGVSPWHSSCNKDLSQEDLYQAERLLAELMEE